MSQGVWVSIEIFAPYITGISRLEAMLRLQISFQNRPAYPNHSLQILILYNEIGCDDCGHTAVIDIKLLDSEKKKKYWIELSCILYVNKRET